MPDPPPVVPITLVAHEVMAEEHRTDKSMPPTTTLQQDVVTAGQRRINLIWESTQALIAILITGAVVTAALRGIESSVLTNAFFLIVGFYFSRTNHTAIGGIGRKMGDTQQYVGR